MSADGIETMRSESDLRRAMFDEATRIERWARIWDMTYRRRAHRWSLGSSGLAVVAALLAAGAGATGLSKVWTAVVPALLALAAAAVSGVTSALGASRRATEYLNAAVSNSGLADAARIFLTTVVEDLPIADVKREFAALCKRRDAIVHASPITGQPMQLTEQQLTAQPPPPVDISSSSPSRRISDWLARRVASR